ncbi:MAG: hypothetical protein U0U70_09490 [Chitinophagaceae bacterium]
MKVWISAILDLFILNSAFSQSANVTWGDEFKLRKGSTDLSVFYTDNTGIYLKESHSALKSYFVIGATLRESASLVKLDKTLTEVYNNDFSKELKGKEFESFYFIKDKLYLLASDYSNKEKTITLFAALVDKSTGELSGDWVELTNWVKNDKKEDVQFKADYNADSSRMVLVSTILGREKNNFEIRQFDINLRSLGKPVFITNEFEQKLYTLEDVVYAYNDNIVLVGREYEYQEGKKKKSKYLDFRNYNIRIYNDNGKMIKELNTTINGKWLISTRVEQTPSRELVLAGFYSNTKRGKTNGLMVQRVNPATGETISTSDKELNTSMIVAADDDNDDGDDDESRKERKEREKFEKIQNEEDGFSKYYRFRKFITATDGGIVILAEEYESYRYTNSEYVTSRAGSGYWRTNEYQVYECGDIMMSKMEAASGNISWLYVVPKLQREVINIGFNGNGVSIADNSYFWSRFNWPFYAGIGVLPGNNTLTIVFNDNKANKDVLQLGQKVKRVSYFGKSDCFGITLNTGTGKYTRSLLFSNKDVPTAMPRLSSVLGRDMYLVGKEDRILAKSKVAIAKVTVK